MPEVTRGGGGGLLKKKKKKDHLNVRGKNSCHNVIPNPRMLVDKSRSNVFEYRNLRQVFKCNRDKNVECRKSRNRNFRVYTVHLNYSVWLNLKKMNWKQYVARRVRIFSKC